MKERVKYKQKQLACLAASTALLVSLSAAAQQRVVTFACGAQGSDVCYFSIFYASGGVRNFTMKAGERDQINGVVVGSDTYCVTVGNPNPSNCSRKKISDFNY